MKAPSGPRLSRFFYYVTLLLLPTQFGKHFWPTFSTVLGIRVDYLSPTLYVTDISIIFLFITTCFSRELLTFFPSSRKEWIIALGIIVYFFALSSVSQSPLLSLYGMLRLIEVVFLARYTAHIVQMKTVSVLPFLAIGVVWESVLAVFQFIHQGAFGGALYFVGERLITPETPGAATVALNGHLLLRPYGTFSHPNQLAGYLLVVVSLVLFRNTHIETKFQKTVYLLATLLGSLGIIVSLSRTALLLLFIVLFLWIGKRFFQITRTQQAVRVAVFFGILIVVFIVGAQYRFLGVSLSDESIVERQVLTHSAIQILIHHPLFGVGLLQFIPSLPKITTNSQYLYVLQPVHNIFLLTASETGLIGLGLFLWLLVSLCQKLLRTQFKALVSITPFSVLVAVGVIISSGMIDHYFQTLIQTQLLFGVVIGLGFGVAKKTSS